MNQSTLLGSRVLAVVLQRALKKAEGLTGL
jgi:hypothetical protein